MSFNKFRTNASVLIPFAVRLSNHELKKLFQCKGEQLNAIHISISTFLTHDWDFRLYITAIKISSPRINPANNPNSINFVISGGIKPASPNTAA